jgi:adenylate kinase family enzyme
MKAIIIGNSGSGKSTLASEAQKRHQVDLLSLDDVAFSTGALRRPVEESIAEVKRFIDKSYDWIIEGCYADIVAGVLDYCEELVFLNPGVDKCLVHCRARPWEPGKFSSQEEQNENLANLLEWVRQYETRSDEFGLARHRSLFESFKGPKFELTDPSQYNNWFALRI